MITHETSRVLYTVYGASWRRRKIFRATLRKSKKRYGFSARMSVKPNGSLAVTVDVFRKQ